MKSTQRPSPTHRQEYTGAPASARRYVQTEPCAPRSAHPDERYYISSLPADRLLASRWNLLLRRLWAVENECHHTFDTVFAEDDRRWIEVDPVGALVIVILRRIAYSLLAFYRAVTLRSEERRYPPWKDLLTRIFVAMVAATTDVVSGLRLSFVAAAPTP